MTEETRAPAFARLGDTNYITWVMRMEAELVRKKLWNDVLIVRVDREGKTDEEYEAAVEAKMARRSASKMEEARAEMIMRVEDPQLAYMRDPDPAVVWKELEDVHQSQGFITALANLRTFFTARKGVKQPMSEWISEMRQQAFVLKNLGVPMPDLLIILAITMGLPASFDSLTINLDGTPANELVLANIITRLVNEEKRQSSALTTKSRNTRSLTSNDDVALATSSASVVCFFCEKKGHYKSDCLEKRRYEAWLKEKEKLSANMALCGIESDEELDFPL